MLFYQVNISKLYSLYFMWKILTKVFFWIENLPFLLILDMQHRSQSLNFDQSNVLQQETV